jgi:hypothetical protein
VIAWTWDAEGPDYCGHGITDDEAKAVQAAEACMRDHGATAATVEAARFAFGTVLTSEYIRTGQGRRGRAEDSGIRWEPFAELVTS